MTSILTVFLSPLLFLLLSIDCSDVNRGGWVDFSSTEFGISEIRTEGEIVNRQSIIYQPSQKLEVPKPMFDN